MRLIGESGKGAEEENPTTARKRPLADTPQGCYFTEGTILIRRIHRGRNAVTPSYEEFEMTVQEKVILPQGTNRSVFRNNKG